MENQNWERLGRKAYWLFFVESMSAAIIVLVLWIIVSVIMFINPISDLSLSPSSANVINAVLGFLFLGLMALFFLLLLAGVLYAYIRYISYKFKLDDNSFRIMQGILNKEETSIPYRQIQDVDLERPFLYQIIGVARVAILTSGHNDSNEEGTKGDYSEAGIPVITKSRAESIREELLKHANIEKVENVENAVSNT